MDDNDKLKQTEKDYSSGTMLSGELKEIAIETLQQIIASHKERRAKVTDEVIDKFMSVWKLKFRAKNEIKYDYDIKKNYTLNFCVHNIF